MGEAVTRRLEQELGFDCPLEYLYKFKYRAEFGAMGAEHEFCWVYYGRYDGPVDVNVNEISDWRFIGVDALERELAAAPGNVHALVQNGMDAHQDPLPRWYACKHGHGRMGLADKRRFDSNLESHELSRWYRRTASRATSSSRSSRATNAIRSC